MSAVAQQLTLDSQSNGLPAPPWPPALICESYGTAGNWRIRCSLPGHDPNLGLWGGTKAWARAAERDHRWWHEQYELAAAGGA